MPVERALQPTLRWLFAAALLAVLLGAAAYSVARLPCFQLVGEVTCRVETDGKLVALTFDDGPTPHGVSAVVPVLDRYGVKATFFVVGSEVERHRQSARELVSAGHELGNHTYGHRRMVLRWPSTYAQEIARTDALLRAAGETQPRLLRPPYGKRLIGFPLAAERAGYRMITWDVEDGMRQTTPELYAYEITERVRSGSIILMHPMYGNSELVGEALPLIIENLQSRGFRLVTVSELLDAN